MGNAPHWWPNLITGFLHVEWTRGFLKASCFIFNPKVSARVVLIYISISCRSKVVKTRWGILVNNCEIIKTLFYCQFRTSSQEVVGNSLRACVAVSIEWKLIHVISVSHVAMATTPTARFISSRTACNKQGKIWHYQDWIIHF